MSRSARRAGSAALILPLGGCTEGAEGIAAGVVGLAGLFVLLLFTVPPIMRYLDHREHRDRMRNRRPWSAEPKRPPNSGEGDAA